MFYTLSLILVWWFSMHFQTAWICKEHYCHEKKRKAFKKIFLLGLSVHYYINFIRFPNWDRVALEIIERLINKTVVEAQDPRTKQQNHGRKLWRQIRISAEYFVKKKGFHSWYEIYGDNMGNIYCGLIKRTIIWEWILAKAPVHCYLRKPRANEDRCRHDSSDGSDEGTGERT